VSTSIFFWQPQHDYLRLCSRHRFGKILIIILNYIIWIFFFYISYLLIRHDFCIFWQLLLATILGEIVERWLKKKILWRRPMFNRHDGTPLGLVDSWYRTGSFPSGHALKTAFFFFLVLQTGVFSPLLFLLITSSLLLFRILMGFHYFADIVGGFIMGFFIWLAVSRLHPYTPLDPFLIKLFNFIFRLN